MLLVNIYVMIMYEASWLQSMPSERNTTCIFILFACFSFPGFLNARPWFGVIATEISGASNDNLLWLVQLKQNKNINTRHIIFS